ncbi:RNA polymerase factor sigma-54 [Vagococcus intermedius]|uniref:RNA polymerase factor sigma-54 n=1 Tax=Vagococcus intermedius TaxID=2991418 RepID=A0AAF0CW15_9ENTE|nr:RNA polymerase factor sigma-54 [Vagococcus intermedius]WEG74065.1 RNA polymerase factor sigma-54 [Vagococcus intermedius]WEG76145.1 RNA polymerase factor sigma-54 [Vagococcus intermedius]
MKLNQGFTQQQTQVQKMAMTQQLQQSIQILQFNTDELQIFIQNKALENPLLEVNVSTDYMLSNSSAVFNTYDSKEDTNYLNQIPNNGTSLFESLLDQIHLNYRDTYLRQLIIYLTEYIDVNGYLTVTLEEAMTQTGASYIQLLDALTLLQQLDPAGVGARDLQECLLLQIERDDLAPDLAYLIVEETFEEFANRKWKEIAKRYDISLGMVQEVHDYVQLLRPTPGTVFGEISDQYIRPDLVVKISKDDLTVLSTKSGAPSIIFQQAYFNKMSQVEDQDVAAYLKEKKAEFDWIQKSIIQRGDTILRVGKEIVTRQKDFFLKPERPLNPMTLREIAETLEVHESTVSRTVNGKYLETSFGVFELRTFFSTALVQSGGEDDVSASTVQAKIKQVIAQENKQKPLSDQKIVELLASEKVDISRRTVAKYRDILGIPSSSKRKRFD